MFRMTLQTIPEVPVEKFSPDTLKYIAESTFEKLASTPIDQLLRDLFTDTIHFGIKVIIALLIYLAGLWIIRRIKNLLIRIFTRREADRALITFVSSLVSISLTVLLIIISVGILGVNTTSLAALLAAGGMAVGMALSGTVQNFAGGIMLMIFKPFKAGDFIDALGYSGTVSEVNIVSTKLVSIDNKVIILPNGALSGGNINNYSQKEFRRVDQYFDVEYGSDFDHVKEAMLEIIKSDERILDSSTPGCADPFISLYELKESGIRIVSRVWVRAGNYWDVFFFLNENIYKQLPQKGISFPFPQLDVHVSEKNQS